ncbi:hypothetical protein BH23CHL4_BH23CHL4_23290 [soil metagenome]
MPRTDPAPSVPPDAAPPPTPGTGPRSGGRFKPQPLIASPGPDPDTPIDQVRLAVGLVIGAHGLQGELKVRPLTGDPDQFETFQQFYVGDESQPRKVRGVRFHAGNVLLRLTGITSPDAVNQLRGAVLRVPGTAVRPLEEGEFFLYQLIGLEARTEQGDVIGVVVDLMETGAADVLVIEDQATRQQTLLPNLPDVVLEIEPGHGFMIVRPLEYLE